jgi:hypothetical protein
MRWLAARLQFSGLLSGMHAFHCGTSCFSSCHFVPASHRRIPLSYRGSHGENLHICGGPPGPRGFPHRVHDTGNQRFRSVGAAAYLGHRNIQNTTRYTALAPERLK